ncbi:hypothetical protein [Halobaculum gomorrense]|uniref:hypothetical protein n=1 Tax=Halobaculum gomorrense TaxID=43928 RepID=UPI000933175F|nr:hypothetical protein [Halobaculum gomorrense]
MIEGVLGPPVRPADDRLAGVGAPELLAVVAADADRPVGERVGRDGGLRGVRLQGVPLDEVRAKRPDEREVLLGGSTGDPRRGVLLPRPRSTREM